MCFTIKAVLRTQLKRAIHAGDEAWIKEIEERMRHHGIEDYYLKSGFEHPAVLIYTKEHPNDPILAYWGFVPEATKDKQHQMQIWNKTLNARGEDMFETWSYKKSAGTKRCLICVDGFFEHYHWKGKTYPHYIHSADNEPLTLAGLWSEWTDKETGETLKTFSIVTSEANALMAKIHNNPKLKGPRMPLILPEDAIDEWLTAKVSNNADKQKILDLVKPYNEKELKAYTVEKITGKNALGNVPEATREKVYKELKDNENKDWTLF